MRLNKEQLEQIQLMKWIRSQQDISRFVFSIPNEGKRSPQLGLIMKAMGLRKGASDIFIAIPRGKYHGMFLELKAEKNKPTEAQFEFMRDMVEQNYYCVWSSGHKEAQKEIIAYLALE